MNAPGDTNQYSSKVLAMDANRSYQPVVIQQAIPIRSIV